MTSYSVGLYTAGAALSIISTPVSMVVGTVTSLILGIKAIVERCLLSYHKRASQDISKASEERQFHTNTFRAYEYNLNQTTKSIKAWAKLIVPLGGLFWFGTDEIIRGAYKVGAIVSN